MRHCPACGATLGDDLEVAATPALRARTANADPSRTRVDRSPRRWPAAVAVIILVAVTAWALTRDTSRGTSHSTAPAPTPTSVAPTESTNATGQVVPPPLAHPPVSTGALLVSAASRGAPTLVVQSVDSDDVTTVAIPDDEPGRSVHRLIATGSTVVVVVTDLAGQGTIWGFDTAALTSGGRPVRLGDGYDALPAPPQDTQRVAILSDRALRTFVQEVAVDGSIQSPRIPIPSGYVPEALIHGGLVLQGSNLQTGKDTLKVWNPDTDTFVAELAPGRGPLFFGAAGSTVAWREPGDATDEVHVHDETSGLDRAIILGLLGTMTLDRGTTSDAALTPDGAAMAYTLHVGPNGYGIGVLDVGSGDVQVEAAANNPSNYAWSPDGRWLFAETDGVFLYTRDGTSVGELATTGERAAVAPLMAVISDGRR